MDIKYPMVIIPHESMKIPEAPRLSYQIYRSENDLTIFIIQTGRDPSRATAQVHDAVHARVAQLISWSMSCASSGVWPMEGFEGNELDPKSIRHRLRGQPIANGWRLGLLQTDHNYNTFKKFWWFTRNLNHAFNNFLLSELVINRPTIISCQRSDVATPEGLRTLGTGMMQKHGCSAISSNAGINANTFANSACRKDQPRNMIQP